jgi:hypothetical protein
MFASDAKRLHVAQHLRSQAVRYRQLARSAENAQAGDFMETMAREFDDRAAAIMREVTSHATRHDDAA